MTAKVAVVTGGASGIGFETVKALAEAGATVMVADYDQAAADRAAQAVSAAGGRAGYVRADVTVPADVTAMVATTVETFGRLDVLVNNAGIVLPGTVLQTQPEDFDRLMAVNVRGVYLCCQAAVGVMVGQGRGVIVNVASIAGLVAVRERLAYCASKGAVIAMTRALAMDHVADKVRVNCVCPGTVHTPLVEKYIREFYEPQGKTRDEVLRMLDARQPMGRMARPDEIASAVLYLASEASGFVTGSALVIDGGWTAQ